MEAPTVYEKLLTDDTVGSGKVGPARAARCKEWVAYADFKAGSTAGTYVVEVAPHIDYAGTWKSKGTLVWAAASSIVSLNFTGIEGAIRIRNTVAVANGVADIYLIGRW